MSALGLAVVSRPPWRQPSVKARRLASPTRAHDMGASRSQRREGCLLAAGSGNVAMSPGMVMMGIFPRAAETVVHICSPELTRENPSLRSKWVVVDYQFSCPDELSPRVHAQIELG